MDEHLSSGRRLVVVAAAAAAYAAAAALLWWAARVPLRQVRQDPGTADLDTLLAALAAALALALLAWLAAGTALSAVAALPRLRGSALERIAVAVTPAALRRATAALLGVAVLGGPALALPARAGVGPPARPVVAAQEVHASAPTAAVDRPATAGAVDRPATAGAPARWTPDPPVRPPRVAAPDRIHLVSSPPRAPRTAVVDELVVRAGDTLWDITARHLGPGAGAAEIAAEWPRWWQANREVIGPDPSLIHPGQLLVPPAPA